MLKKLKTLDVKAISISFIILLIAGALSDQFFILANYFQNKNLPSSSEPLNVVLGFLTGLIGFLVIGRKVKINAVFIAMGMFLLFILLYQIIFSQATILPFNGSIRALFFGSLVGYLSAKGKLTVQ